MNNHEWLTVKARIFRMFPSVAAWGARLSAESKQAVGQRWEAALSRYEAADVNDTIDLLAAQPDSPWPFSSDYERIGAIIARETGDRIAQARDRATSPAASLPPRATGYTSTGIMSRVSAAIEADGRHSDECLAHRQAYDRCLPECPVRGVVGRELGAEDVGLQPDGQRFDCPLCRDTGAVSCLAATEIVATVRTGLAPAVPRTYSAYCSCQRGQRREECDTRSGRPGGVRYDAERDVRAFASEAEIVTTCRALVETWGGRRNSGFDAFNRAG